MNNQTKGWVTTLALFFLLLTSCATQEIGEYDRPWTVIRAAVVKSLPRGLSETSENGRTLVSNYFVPRGEMTEDGNKSKERGKAIVTILGASRPYTLDVKVVLEVLDGKDYSEDGTNTGLAKKLVVRIRKELANRREDRNLIDDFHAF